ncbi:ester cyclase [Pseudarthrobacter cellobiosi]|uniref:ester cyclase n=1 Tax=Pseudarthrobacter cellobiosi TaxID=2953654 RepID=UPI00208FF559|nr:MULTISPECIES: ester cyclase [unclassified Pseudarthrobacter]MCO4256313.1 ester cyclase [Pseudarthrobacter sp. HLT1-5]MCO4275662.1 ester cyclase [Pseudarthrobacter sp. HLT3-5]
MTTDQNKEVVRRFFRAFEDQDEAELTRVLSPKLQAFVHGNTEPVDRDTMLTAIKGWNITFSGTSFTLADQIAEGDMVACRVTMHAVHSGGEFQGIAPTGAPITSESLTLERVVDGLIVERRVATNWEDIKQQLTAVPSQAQTAG